MRHLTLILLANLFSLIIFAKEKLPYKQKDISIVTATGQVKGELDIPKMKGPMPVVLMIAGSGPTDRDGNNVFMQNNSLKMLAEELVKANIAVCRYDKRGIAQSKDAMQKESDLRFDDFWHDAAAFIELLKRDKRFSQVIVLGHSEGSLLGMIALQHQPADGFISIAGASLNADSTLLLQLKTQPAFLLNESRRIIDSLRQGKTVTGVSQFLSSLFRPSVQPYLMNWFKYNPCDEFAKISNVPSLILQGTNDIQVDVADAKRLSAVRPQVKMVLIEGINHIFKPAPADREGNVATYSKPELPIMKQLSTEIINFVNSIKK